MPSNANIEQFTVADTEALLAFLREAYPDDPRKSEPHYWKWHYLENPYTSLDDVPLWVLREDGGGGRIVGQVATIPVALKVGAAERRAIWILDFIVHEDYRGQGWGRRLLDTARDHCRTMIALGINAGSTGVLNSQKWSAMGSINRYHLLLNPGTAVKELSRLPRPLGRAVNLAYAPLRPRPAAQRTPGVSLRAVDQFDADFDDLWQRAAAQWPCAVVRRAGYLDWQFRRQPGKRYETLAVYAGGRLAGYVVLFFRKPEGGSNTASPKVAISDLCYDASFDFDVIDELLRAALDAALARRAGSLVTDVLDARVEERLVRRGFWRIKRAPGFMVYSETERAVVNDPRNWFLTRADSDVSIFEHPNL